MPLKQLTVYDGSESNDMHPTVGPRHSNKARQGTDHRLHLGSYTKLKSGPHLAHPSNHDPPLLSPTPIRSSSMDATLPPAYTPLALDFTRPTAPVRGLSSCSPRTPRTFVPTEAYHEELNMPSISKPVLIPSPGQAQVAEIRKKAWRPAKLEMTSLSPHAGADARAGRDEYRGKAPRTAGVLTHTRWVSLPCAIPAAVPITAGVQAERLQHSHLLPRGQYKKPDDDSAIVPLHGRTQDAGSIRIPSFDDPRERFHGRSFTSDLNPPLPDAHSQVQGRVVGGTHKRSLSEKLKRLIIPTLPIKRDKEFSRNGSDSGSNENIARSAALPDIGLSLESAGLANGREEGGIISLHAQTRAQGKISTEHLHLSLDVHAPERPYRSPGTASFMVRRDDWAYRGRSTANPAPGASDGRPAGKDGGSTSAEAQAEGMAQKAKRRQSDEAIWEYAQRGLDYQAGYEERASVATFGTRGAVLVPYPYVESVDGASDAGAARGRGNELEGGKEAEAGGEDSDTTVLWRNTQDSRSHESSERSFGTSPVSLEDETVLLY